MKLTDAVTDLYGLAPEAFLARRKELVAEARAAKDRDTAKLIGALRRPAVAAWLVNLLRRDDEGGRGLTELAALGVQLRQAQFSLEAARLRELGRERRTRVADLVSRAVDLAETAGHAVSPAVEREIDETLVAAVADEAATEAVLSGSLTRPLSYSGFGEVDLELAVAMPREAPPTVIEPSPDAQPEELLRTEREARIQEITATLRAAESASTTTSAVALQAAERLDQARATATSATRAVADLERQLESAREVAAQADAQQQAAEQEALAGERAEQSAKGDVERLRHELTNIS